MPSEEQKRANVSNSARAGLIMPVGQTKRRLKESRNKHMGDRAAVVGTAGAEFITEEIIRTAGEFAGEKRTRIAPQHIQQALIENPELRKICKNIYISGEELKLSMFPGDLKTNKQLTKLRKKRRREMQRAANETATTANGIAAPAVKKSKKAAKSKKSK